MTKYVALLRAVNVGGTGKVPMAELKVMCREAGFTRVQTYIASGNVVFESKASSTRAKSNLERRLRDYAGKPVGVVVRTASEMQAILRANPFPNAAPKHTYAIFLDEPPPRDVLKHATGHGGRHDRLRAPRRAMRSRRKPPRQPTLLTRKSPGPPGGSAAPLRSGA